MASMKCRWEWSFVGRLSGYGWRGKEPDAADAAVGAAASLAALLLESGAESLRLSDELPDPDVDGAPSCDPLPERLFGIPAERTEAPGSSRRTVAIGFEIEAGPASERLALPLLRLLASPPKVPGSNPVTGEATDCRPEFRASALPDSEPPLPGCLMWSRPGERLDRDDARWSPGRLVLSESRPVYWTSADLRDGSGQRCAEWLANLSGSLLWGSLPALDRLLRGAGKDPDVPEPDGRMLRKLRELLGREAEKETA